MDQATPPDARPDAYADPRLLALLDRLAAETPLRAPGLDLSHLRACPDVLAAEAGTADPESGGLPLTGADLSGARMEEADFAGANLRRATLGGVVGRSTRFTGAILEEADLSEADLSGADSPGRSRAK